MSWGAQAWGPSPWGVGAQLALDSLVVVGERRVRVDLTAAPLAVSPIGQSDALNPRMWEVYGGADDALYQVWGVKQRAPTQFDLLLRDFLPSPNYNVRVAATLQTPLGFVITSNSGYVEGPGVLRARTRPADAGPLDFDNPPFEGDRAAGTWATESDGSRRMVGGEQFLRKLIIRRLTSTPGVFFHIPGYGLGVRVKEPFGTADLIRLQVDAAQQIRREPEVEAASVALEMGSDGVLILSVQARLLASGRVVHAQVPVRVSL